MNVKTDLRFGKLYELAAAQLCAEQLWPGSTVAACPTYADIDFVVTVAEKGLVAFLEIKTRRVDSAKYDSTIVHVNKHHAGRWGKTFFKVPTVCLVVFTDNAA